VIARLMLVVAALISVAGAATAQDVDPESQATRVATFGGGCFWCMEPPYDELDGVLSTTSGYMGGETANPTYRQVVSGRTGHVEVVQVEYDPARVDFGKLLDVFWVNVDPLTDNRQFCDAGESYRPVIFVHTERQRALAEASKRAIIESGRFEEPVIVPVETAGTFWPAEDYHQDYYTENPVRYKYYRWRCGRDERLEALWGEPPPKDPDSVDAAAM